MGDPAGGARRRRKSRCLKSLSLNSAGKHDRNKAGGLGTASWRRADTSPASHCPDRNSLRGVLCLYKAARFSSAASPDRSPDKHDSLQLTLHRFFFYLEAFYAQLWSLDRRAYSHIYSPLAGLLNANRFKVKSRVQVQFIPGRFFSNGNREELLEPSGGLNGIFGGSSWVCSEVGPFEWRTEEVRNSLQCQLSWLSASSL